MPSFEADPLPGRTDAGWIADPGIAVRPAPVPGSEETSSEFRPDPFRGGDAAPNAADATGRSPDSRLDIDALVAEARQTALAEGRAEGHAAGVEEGIRVARTEALASAAGALAESVRHLETLQRRYLFDQRRRIVDLALAVASRIVDREVSADLDVLASAIERSVSALGAPARVVVRISPGDLATLEAGNAPTLAELTGALNLGWEADPKLGSGDVRVLSDNSEVDLRRSELLRRIGEELAPLAELTPDAGEEGT